MAITNYAAVTLVLPDNRVLLRRQRMNKSSVTQWQATSEFAMAGGQSAWDVVAWKLMQEFGLIINSFPEALKYYDIKTLPIITIGNQVRSITSYVIKVLNAWNFRTPRIFEFHAKPFEELLDDVYQNSVVKPGLMTGFEKHSFNTIRVLAQIDKTGVLR